VAGLVQSGDTAVDFTNGDVAISDTPQLDFVSAPYTIEAWLKGTPLPSVTTSPSVRVFDKIIAGTGVGYALAVGLNYVVMFGSDSLQTFPSLPSGVADHVVVVSTGAGTGLIYVNGDLVGSGSQITSEAYLGPAHIGVASDGTAHFAGVIGEVAVYNYALSPAQILAHYQAGTQGSHATPFTLFSDLNGTATPGGYVVGQYSPGSTFVIGAAFTPSGQTYTLTQIQALLSFSSGVNSMVLGLYQDSGGVPGQLLESWNLNNVLGSAPAIITVNSVLQPTLHAGQRYWITAGMADATSTGVWWINNIGGACCGSPDEVQGISTGSLNGGPFVPSTVTDVGFHAFAVNGVPQAPTFVYVANRGSDNISAYAMDATAGTLITLHGSPFSSAVGSPNALAVHPTGKFLYVAPFGGSSIEAFSIGTGGVLSPVQGSPFATGSGAISVAVDPTGRFAYVANIFENSVSGFTIDPETGALAPISGSPFPAGSWPYGVTVDPLGRFAYVASCGSGQGCSGIGPGGVSEYTIDPVTGALTSVPGSPVSGVGNPFWLTGDPSGRFVYVTNASLGNVSAFVMTPIVGSLTPTPGSPFPTGVQPGGITVDPTDRFVYVDNGGSASVSAFSIDAATGDLTPIGTFPAGTYAGDHPAVDPTGQYLYVPDSISNNVLGYAINAVTGSLAPLGSFPAGTGPISVAITAPAVPTPPGFTVFPNQAANSGPINVELTGSPLLSGAQVQLSATGLPAIPGTNTSSESPTTLSATFDLTGAAPGARNVVVTPVGSSPIVLYGGFTVLQTPACSYTVAPLNSSFPASGGGGSIVVTSNVNAAQCNFHAFGSFPTNVPWIAPGLAPAIVIGGTGVTAEALAYEVAANPSANPRSTTVSIFGQNVTVSQAGFVACSYSLSPASKIFAAGGGSQAVSIVTAGGCAWSASSNLSWVHVTAGSPGSGTGSVTIQADPNTGGLRSGSMTIAGKTFSVSQSANACGATDVSSQVSVSRGTILSTFLNNYYYEDVTLHNQGTTSVAGPVYLVLDGLPTTRSQCGTNVFGQYQTCGVVDPSGVTYCQSPSGSDMVLYAPNGLAPGQQVSTYIDFVPGPSGGALPPNWYTTRVFSGTPSK